MSKRRNSNTEYIWVLIEFVWESFKANTKKSNEESTFVTVVPQYFNRSRRFYMYKQESIKCLPPTFLNQQDLQT